MPETHKMFDAKGNETKDPGKAVRIIIHVLDSQGKLLEETTLIKQPGGESN